MGKGFVAGIAAARPVQPPASTDHFQPFEIAILCVCCHDEATAVVFAAFVAKPAFLVPIFAEKVSSHNKVAR
jgi:hypothetical protein